MPISQYTNSTTKPIPSVIHYLAQGISYPPKLIAGAYSCMAGLCLLLNGHVLRLFFRYNIGNSRQIVLYIRKYTLNTPGTAGGPGGRDRTLAEKSKKIARKSPFFLGEIKITQKTYFFANIF